MRSSETVKRYDLQIMCRSARPAVPEEKSPTRTVFNLLVALLKPFSRGRLRLRLPNPDAPPIIDLGFLTHREDTRLM